MLHYLGVTTKRDQRSQSKEFKVLTEYSPCHFYGCANGLGAFIMDLCRTVGHRFTLTNVYLHAKYRISRWVQRLFVVYSLRLFSGLCVLWYSLDLQTRQEDRKRAIYNGLDEVNTC